MNQKHVFHTKRWIAIALINFCVVALAGVTMRYKINFSLPVVDQRYMMYGHSNFAFVGWVAIALMALMVRYLVRAGVTTNYIKYRWILIADLIAAYGMMVAFFVQGYDFWSNTFSIITILISYVFIVMYWRDLRHVQDKNFSIAWLKAALALWAFSSFGAIWLAYLLANRVMIQDLYFSALYFFLHFQYNGWFLFVCFGIFFSYLGRQQADLYKISKRLFITMAVLVIPSYFLSIFWLKLPDVVIYTANIAGIAQILILIYFIMMVAQVVRNRQIRFHTSTRWLWGMVSFAFIIKLILMTLSTIPYLSQFAFGYRPVVVGYLHLSFIGVTSLFIFGYINEFIHRFQSRVSGIGALIFVLGFVGQELVLMFQGLEAMSVQPVKSANILLFYCAIMMAAGLIWITAGVIRARSEETGPVRVHD